MIDTTVSIPDETSDEVFKHVAGAASLSGYTTSSATGGTLTISRRVTPGWAKAAAVVGVVLCVLNLSLAPTFVALIWAGLALTLLAKRTEATTLVATDRPDGTELRVMGLATPPVVSLLARVGISSPDLTAQAESSRDSRSAVSLGSPRTWIPVALVLLLCVAVAAGAYLLTRDNGSATSYAYVSPSSPVDRSVSRQIGHDVTCEAVGSASAVAGAYRCAGDGTESCGIVVNPSNLSGTGIRRASADEAPDACPKRS